MGMRFGGWLRWIYNPHLLGNGRLFKGVRQAGAIAALGVGLALRLQLHPVVAVAGWEEQVDGLGVGGGGAVGVGL